MSEIPQVIYFEGKDIRTMTREELIAVVEYAHRQAVATEIRERERLEATVAQFRKMGRAT